MRKLSNGLATVALGMVVFGAVHSAPQIAAAEDSGQPSKSLPGVETAKSIGSSLMSGMEKVGEMIIPAPSVKEAPDPVSLKTKAKPSPALYLSMATVAEEKRNFAGARKHYEQAMKLFPDRTDVILQYARFRDRRDELEEATELYQRAARLSPDDPAPFNDLGLCFARRQMLPQSLSSLERAIQLAPERALHRHNIATVLVEQGNVDAAFGHLKAVHDEAVAYYNLGYLMLKKGETKAAARLFSEALAKNPSLVEAKIWLRQLEGQGATTRNAQRPATPDVRSANRQPRTPGLSMRPPRDQATVQNRAPQGVPVRPQPALSAPMNRAAEAPPILAPMPPNAPARQSGSSAPGAGPLAPPREITPSPKKPVPVLQPLPPVD